MRTNTRSLVRTVLSKEGVLSLWMDAMDTGNALDIAMTEEIADALESVGRVASARCLVIRSTGRHFCTGGNVKDMESGSDLMAGSVADVDQRLRSSLHRIPRALSAIEIPTMAAVNGAAVGAGLDLALMCDLRIASDEATFAESFLRLGLVSGIGGSWYLARIVGQAKALELTLTSEFLSASKAHGLGLVNSVVPAAEFESATDELANKIAAQPPVATRMAKRLVRTAARSDLEATLDLAASLQATLLCGDEHHALVAQFLESRRAKSA